MAKILVVDDERSALWLMSRHLARAGHEPVIAPGGVEAAALFDKSPESYQMLVTDVVMPGMSGLELARRVLEKRPTVPVLIVSGFTSEVWQSPHPECMIGFLAKPFSEQGLVRAVASLLQQAERRAAALEDESGRRKPAGRAGGQRPASKSAG